jgi:hypothetical protein
MYNLSNTFNWNILAVAMMQTFLNSNIITSGEGKLRIETSGGEQHRRPRLT